MKPIVGEMNSMRSIVYDNFISDDELNDLIGIIESKDKKNEMVESTIYDKESVSTKIQPEIRKSKSIICKSGKYRAVDAISDRLLDWLYDGDEKAKVGVAIDLVKYENQGFLKEHQDPFMDGRKWNRVFTAIIYLQEPAGGGHTVYPNLGLSIKPKAKKMFLFKNIVEGRIDEKSVHYGEKVEGVKSIMVIFISENID